MLDVITDHLDIWTTAQKQKKAVGRGSAKKEEGYGIKKLRELILELAVRGKLVPQDPKDEPASVLLEKIAEEKQRLIDEGKIKKQKVLPDILNEEETFFLPDGWIRVRLDDIGNTNIGLTYSPKDIADKGTPVLRSSNIQNGKIDLLDLVRVDKKVKSNVLVNEGDLLICARNGSKALVGKTAMISDLKEDMAFGAFMAIFRSTFNEYVEVFLKSPVFRFFLEGVSTTTINQITQKNLRNTFIPLPPLAEQHRIVAKVDELMALCDQLEQEQADHQATHQTLVKTLLNGLIETATHRPIDPSTGSELTAQDEQASIQHPVHPKSIEGKPPEAQTTADYFNQLIAQHFDTLFTTEDSIDQLKQTILQLAVMGKLVPQNPKDEPASVLLEKIAKEKAKLIKEGKIKKQKALPEITEDEKPFGLPDGWEWVRLPDIGELARGKSKHRPRNAPFLYDGGTIPLVQTGDVARADPLVLTYTAKYNKVGLEQSRLWHTGTLCITIAANIADTGILSFDACFPDSVVGFNCFETDMNVAYFDYFIRTAKNHLEDYAPSTAQKNINLAILGSLLVPLPPLNELNRIVTKVNQLLSLCDTLKDNLNQAQITQTQLADTIVKQAVN